MNSMIGLFCVNCGKEVQESEFRLKCPSCKDLLEVQYDLNQMKESFSSRPPKTISGSILNQWIDILPINDPNLIEKVSIGEQETPLVRSSYIGKQVGIEDLRFKLEFLAPTMSLKDRGTSLCALKALELGFDTLCIPSSGNNAGSTSAYAAKSGLQAIVFIQKDVSPSKIIKIMAYGAQIVRINGDLSTASKVCEKMLENHRWFNCSGLNPYRYTAKRTVAYEIVHQLEGDIPDAVVFPVGGGSGIASAHGGFLEMLKMGIISSMPRLIGVQLEACDPVTRAFEEGLDELPPVTKKSSISDALMHRRPFQGIQALRAARETNGLFVSISDEEFIRTIRLLAAKEGLFLEPAGAISVAALIKLRAQGRLEDLKTVVCTLTGHGLNLPHAALDPKSIPDLVQPEVSAVEAYLNSYRNITRKNNKKQFKDEGKI